MYIYNDDDTGKSATCIKKALLVAKFLFLPRWIPSFHGKLPEYRARFDLSMSSQSFTAQHVQLTKAHEQRQPG